MYLIFLTNNLMNKAVLRSIFSADIACSMLKKKKKKAESHSLLWFWYYDIMVAQNSNANRL